MIRRSTGLRTGVIEVTTRTTGAKLDPDGFTAVLRDVLGRSRTASIGLNDVVAFTNLRENRDYQVRLADFAPNCSVTGPQPVEIFVTADETVRVTFEIICTADP